MKTVVEEALRLLRPSIPADIEIVFKVTASSDMVVANPVELQQVLMNLVTNASQAMAEKGGILEITLADSDLAPDCETAAKEYIQLSVRDAGTGMTAEVMERAFDPYFTTREEGTGMGLAVVYGIVAVSAVLVSGHNPSAIEFMDAHCLDLVRDLLPFEGLGDARAFLLIEADGPPAIIQKQIEQMGEICLDQGAKDVFLAPDSYKRNQLWEVRRRVSLRIEEGSLYPALHRLELRGDVKSEMTSSENNRRARVYTLAPAGRRRLGAESESWEQFAAAMRRVLRAN